MLAQAQYANGYAQARSLLAAVLMAAYVLINKDWMIGPTSGNDMKFESSLNMPEEKARLNRFFEILLRADLQVLHDLIEKEKMKVNRHRHNLN